MNNLIINNFKKILSCILVSSSAFVSLSTSFNNNKTNFSKPSNSIIVNNDYEKKVKTSTAEAIASIDILNDDYTENELNVNHYQFRISDQLYNEISNLVKNHNINNGFYVVSLDEKLSFGYNPDTVVFAASTIKAYYSLYAYKKILENNISFNEEMIYLKKHYCAGSGIMQDNYSFGSKLTLDKIFELTLNISDNCAYTMLVDRFGSEGYNEYIEQLGCKTHKITPVWAQGSARDSVLLWKEIYSFYKENGNLGNKLFKTLIDAKYNDLKEVLPEYISAHKSGWTQNKACNETGIVFGPRPYYVAIMTNDGPTNYNKTFVKKLISLIDEAMLEYTKYEEDRLNKIKILN